MEEILKPVLSFPKGIASAVSLLIVLTSVLVPNAYAVKATQPSHTSGYLRVVSVPSQTLASLKTNPVPTLGASLKVSPKPTRYGVTNLKAIDPTNTKKMKRSRAARESIPVKVWATSWTATQIAYDESRNNCKDVSSNGIYRGKWQMDAHFWATYGGLKFASRPDLATCEQQDIVAHNGWISRHYQPWQTYSLVN